MNRIAISGREASGDGRIILYGSTPAGPVTIMMRDMQDETAAALDLTMMQVEIGGAGAASCGAADVQSAIRDYCERMGYTWPTAQ
jgi:hypothetical protein